MSVRPFVCSSVSQHFEDMYDDQHDFLQYCMRKMTMRACVDMIRNHDTLYTHKYFVRAAKRAVQCYLELHDRQTAELQTAFGACRLVVSPFVLCADFDVCVCL